MNQKELMNKLRELEARYQVFAESSLNVLTALDETGRLIYASPSYEPVLGYAPEEVIGVRVGSLTHPDDQAQLRAAIENTMKTHKPNRVVYRFKHKHGHWVWLESAGRYYINDEGKLRGAAVSRDITEMKELEAQLRTSEKMWRSIAEQMPDLVIVLDTNHNIEYINRDLPNLPKEAAIGRSLYTYFLPRYHPTVKQHIDAVFQEGASVNFETAGLAAYGNMTWWSSRAGPIMDNGVVARCVLVSNDITQRKQIEEELAKKKSEFEAIFESIPDTILFTDLDTRIVMVNPAIKAMFGHSPTSIAGKLASTLYVDQEVVSEQTKAAKKSKDPKLLEPAESLCRHKSGNVFLSETYTTLVKDNQGNPLGFLSIIRDITTRKQAEQDKQQLQEQLKEYAKQLEGKVKRLEKDHIKLNRKEQLVLCNFAKNPFMPDQELAELTNLKRSTVTAIRNRLQKAGFTRPILFPNLSLLGFDILTIVYGDYVEEHPAPEEVLLEIKNKQKFLRLYVFKNFAHYTRVMATQKKLGDTEHTFSLESSTFHPPSQIAKFLSNLMDVPAEIAQPSAKAKREKLSFNDTKILKELIKHPLATNQKISELTGFSKLTVSKKRKGFIARGILYPTLYFDAQLLHLKVLKLYRNSGFLDSAVLSVKEQDALNLVMYKAGQEYASQHQGRELFRMHITDETRITLQLGSIVNSL